MVSKRLSIYGFISAAALVSGVMAGCGGSSNSASGNNPVIDVTGQGVIPTAGTAPATPSSPSAQQVQVTVGGSPVFGGGTATLPAGESVGVGGNGQVCLIPGNPSVDPNLQPFLNQVTFSALVKKRVPGTVTKSIAGDPGDVYVDGQPTGVFVNSQGGFTGYIVLTPGNHTLQVYGPFTVNGPVSQLTVTQFQFGVTVGTDGIGSIPNSLVMRLPSNGGHLSSNCFANVTYPTPDFSGGQGSLTLTYGSVTKAQTKTVVNGAVGFSDLFADPSDVLPGSGVNTVTFNYISAPVNTGSVVKKK